MQMQAKDKNNRLARLLYPWMAIINLHHNHLYHQAQHNNIRSPLLDRTGSQYHGVYIRKYRSCFLATPATQVKDMFKKSRLLLTLLYLGAIIGTVVLAILLPDNLKALVLIMLIVQIIAYYLYTLSYIPFGQKILKKCCQCILFWSISICRTFISRCRCLKSSFNIE